MSVDQWFQPTLDDWMSNEQRSFARTYDGEAQLERLRGLFNVGDYKVAEKNADKISQIEKQSEKLAEQISECRERAARKLANETGNVAELTAQLRRRHHDIQQNIHHVQDTLRSVTDKGEVTDLKHQIVLMAKAALQEDLDSAEDHLASIHQSTRGVRQQQHQELEQKCKTLQQECEKHISIIENWQRTNGNLEQTKRNIGRACERDKADIKKENERLVKQVEDLQNALSGLKVAHEAEMHELRTANINSTDSLTKNHDNAMRQLQTLCASTKQKALEDVSNLKLEMGRLRNDHATFINQLNLEHNGRVSKMTSTHSSTVQEIERERTAELLQLSADHEAAVKSANDETANLRIHFTQLQQQHATGLDMLRDEHNALVAQLNGRHAAEMRTVRDVASAIIGGMQGAHALLSARSDMNHAADMRRIRLGALAVIGVKERDHDSQLVHLNNGHSVEVSRVRRGALAVIGSIKGIHQRHAAILQTKHDVRIDELTKTHDDQVSAIRSEHQNETGRQASAHEEALRVEGERNKGLGDDIRSRDAAAAQARQSHEAELAGLQMTLAEEQKKGLEHETQLSTQKTTLLEKEQEYARLQSKYSAVLAHVEVLAEVFAKEAQSLNARVCTSALVLQLSDARDTDNLTESAARAPDDTPLLQGYSTTVSDEDGQ
ncbi:hypothetical protein LTS18_012722 [Coniosporium uncinatum]|uniref:Uncharacterized protein n=1 Tax=Coniosporium uncinatum TaxID=93489 RepID=A0ACC3DC01_9PEZI|nr:hypothetical protein LTS18_012722 [Coniosporium uncinatum]